MIIRVKAKAFGKIGKYEFRVEDDDVRVWDDVAKTFTLCHGMSDRAVQRIRDLAREIEATRGN